LFKVQQELLFGKRLEPGAAPDSILQRESQLQVSLNLPELKIDDVAYARQEFRRRTRFHAARGAIAAAAALAAAFGLYLFQGDRWSESSEISGGENAYLAKGEAQVQVFYERDGKTQALASDFRLSNGDRVRAEVLTPYRARVYWAVFDHTGRPLIPLEQFLSNTTDIDSGSKAAMPDSFRLVGKSEGETLVAIVCDLSRNDELAKRSAVELRKGFGEIGKIALAAPTHELQHHPGLPVNCSIASFVLR